MKIEYEYSETINPNQIKNMVLLDDQLYYMGQMLDNYKSAYGQNVSHRDVCLDGCMAKLIRVKLKMRR